MRFPTTTVEWADLAAKWLWIALGLSAVSSVLNQGRGALSILFAGYESIWFLGFMVLPAWRYTTWLRAVARAEASAADGGRVLTWIGALKILTGLGFGILTVTSMASFLSIGFYALPIVLVVGLIGFVIFKLLGAVHGWVSFQTTGQNTPRRRVSLASSPLPQLSCWIRATQALGLLALVIIPKGGPPLSLSSLLNVASTATVILALEFTLRFAHASAQPIPHDPSVDPA